MRHYAVLALSFSLGLLLTSCSREGLLVVSDQFWSQGELIGGGVERGLVDAGKRNGITVAVATVDQASTGSAKLATALRASRAEIVLLSPLYSAKAADLARQFPKKRIVAFESGPSQAHRPSNLVRLVSDPGSAFRRAGERVARILGSGSDASKQIAAVFSSDHEGEIALTAFSAGLDSGSIQFPLSTIRVGGTADETALRRFIEDSRAKNTGLYLLAAPALNAYAVQLLKDSKIPIVTENWIYGSTYSDKVVFSIDKDIPSALMKVVETMGRPADNEIRIPWDLVAAPTNS